MAKKKRSFTPPNVFRPDRDPHGKQKVKGRYMLGVLAATAAAYGIYLFCFNMGFIYIIHIYAAVLFISLMVFGIMNRGFSQTLPDAEDIPDSALLEKEIKRRRTGRYFLVPAIAVMITFMIDFIWLQFLQPLFGG